jgi:TnpA family transposase
MSNKRLSILTPEEIDSIFSCPRFSEDEREYFFTLSKEEKVELEKFRGHRSKVYFILQLGYFKARNQFFTFEWNDVQKDRDYIIQKHYYLDNSTEIPAVNTRSAQQKAILELLNFRIFDSFSLEKLTETAKSLCKIHIQPRFLFTEMLRILESDQLSLPGYSTFQKIISIAITFETKRLSQLIKESYPKEIKRELSQILLRESTFYELTALKKRIKDFKLKQIKQEINKHQSIKDLYLFFCQTLPTLKLSNENVKYYASLAEYYPIHRLQNMPRMQAYLYLSCFIYHCYEEISDNLINSFIFLGSNFAQQAKAYSHEKIAENSLEQKNQLNKTGELIKIFVDESIDDNSPFGEVKKKAFSIIDEDKIKQVVRYLSGEKLSAGFHEWEFITYSARKISLYLRPLFLSLDFKSTFDSDPVIKAADLLKEILGQGKQLWPELKTAIKKKISKGKKPWIRELPQYEFLIYSMLRKGLEAGDIYYNASTRFKSFEEDLVTKEEVKNKKEFLGSLGFPQLIMPMADRLNLLKSRLEQRYLEVNENVKKGTHQLKVFKKGDSLSWSLPYKKQEENINNPVYEKLPQVGIISLLQFVDQQCGFLGSFKHIQPRYSKNLPDQSSLIACLVSLGERFGHSKMADISDTKIHSLRSTSNNYIRLETTRKANDRITNATAKLAIFKHFNLDVGTIHASADGQKFEAKNSVLKARYSPKYFGLNKGLVNYSMIVNHVPANARLIGANEHESHYALDIVLNNSSEVSPDIISVDMAGTNQVNFALLETFGRTWAPRYTKINKKESKLVGFQFPSTYPEGILIKPAKKINEALILNEEDNLNRIFASLALKKTTQSTIVRKLSSFSRSNRTKKALWELDSIYFSLYLLEYLDSSSLRTNVQRALNRGESYHQLHRAITQPNGGKFKGSSENEIAIENDCTRLIANAIIFYNSMMLSILLEKAQKEGKMHIVEIIKRLSPVAWRHINLYGRFEFNRKVSLKDMWETLKNLSLNEAYLKL